MDEKPATGTRGMLQEVRDSVLEARLVPETDKERAWLTRHLLLLHLRPVRLPATTLRWTHTFGLGGTCLVLITLLAGTGLLMMLHYQPTPDGAWASVYGLERGVPFGQLVRNVHFLSANLLVVAALAHLLRVFLTGGFTGPRRFNWIVGLGLLVGVLAANFTGYLLPWDQLSYWAVTISTGMLAYVPAAGEWLRGLARGGTEIGSATLVLFYTLHTSVLPVTLLVLMAFHFWRVRRAGGVVLPRAVDEPVEHEPDKVLFLPNLLQREVVQALVVTAGITATAVVVGAPLGQAANPGMSPNPAKAPWYFAGFQELLLHLHPVVAVTVLPALGLLALALVPYVATSDTNPGVWLRSRRGRRLAVLAAAAGASGALVWIAVDEVLGTPAGWLPPVGVAVVVVGGWWVLRQRLRATPAEAIQTMLVGLLAAFVVLTVTCAWFRGAGMALTWPWLVP